MSVEILFLSGLGLWHAENKWDEEGSAAYLSAAQPREQAAPEPEQLEAYDFGDVTIPADKLQVTHVP